VLFQVIHLGQMARCVRGRPENAPAAWPLTPYRTLSRRCRRRLLPHAQLRTIFRLRRLKVRGQRLSAS